MCVREKERKREREREGERGEKGETFHLPSETTVLVDVVTGVTGGFGVSRCHVTRIVG